MTNKELLIVRESLELFHLYGIRSLNLEDISRLVKLPLRVLKRYFPTKECLLQKCVKYRISQEEIFKYTDDSLLDILIRFSEAFLPLYRKISHRCCQDIRKYYATVFQFLYRYMDYYAVVCQNKAQDGIIAGYIRLTTSPQQVYAFFRQQLSGLLVVNEEPDKDSRHITEETLLFARDIATAKGRIYIDNELKKRK